MSENRRAWGMTLGVIVLLIAAIAGVGMLTDGDEPRQDRPSATQPPTDDSPSMLRVRYTVSVDGTIASNTSIHYTNETGGQERAETNQASWSKTLNWDRPEFAYISARLPSDAAAQTQIGCTIAVNGEVVEESHATGANGNVTCSGNIAP